MATISYIDYSEYISTRVEESIQYAEYVNEVMSNSTDYSEYCDPEREYPINYAEYVAEMLDKCVDYDGLIKGNYDGKTFLINEFFYDISFDDY